jgi:pimeloyl-ACP methyl ester carboxylesterase
MRGEKSRAFFTLISEAITKCVPGARQVVLPNVNHDAPWRDPAAFTAAILEFLSKR